MTIVSYETLCFFKGSVNGLKYVHTIFWWFVLTLIKMFTDASLLVEFKTVKFFCVPTVSFENDVIHCGGVNCSLIGRDASKSMLDFYENLSKDYETNRFSHKNVSFIDLFNDEDKYCQHCFKNVRLAADAYDVDAEMMEDVDSLIATLKVKVARVSSDAYFTDFSDWDLLHGYGKLNTIFQSFEGMNDFNLKFHERLFNDSFLNISKEFLTMKEKETIVEDNIWEFLLSVFFPKVPSQDGSDFNMFLNGLKSNFQNSHFKTNDMVIFNSNFLTSNRMNDLFRRNSSYTNLCRQILFNPNFNISSFAVLPALHFEVLKIMFEKLLPSELLETFSRESVVCKTVPSEETLEMMKNLFVEGNETMSDYKTLYEIVTSI